MAQTKTERANLKIAGYEKIISQLEQLRDYLCNSQKYLEKGIHIPKGVLIYGLPGVGKTVMAKYIASEGINLINLRAADCTKVNSEEYIIKAFKEAKSKKPCLLLIDELDKIAGLDSDYYMEMNDKAMKVLLQELDSLKDENGVLVVATCNDIERLGNALIRSGRFDKIYKIDLPNYEDRIKILKMYLDKINIDKDVDLNYFARMTSGRTGAEIENFANESAIIAVEENNSLLNRDCFQKAMDRICLHGLEGKIEEDKKHKVAIHEAGHCLVQLYLKPDTVSGASIIPQGNSNGRSNYVQMMENRENESELDEIAIALGGRVAEVIEFGISGPGCSNDIRKAVIATDYLLTECGMFGYEYVVSLGRLGIQSGDQNSKICEKRIEILNEQHDRVKSIILEHKEVYNKIVETLELNHTMTREELLALRA